MVNIPNTHEQEILASNTSEGRTDTQNSIVESEQHYVAIKPDIEDILYDHIYKKSKILENHCAMVDHRADATV